MGLDHTICTCDRGWGIIIMLGKVHNVAHVTVQSPVLGEGGMHGAKIFNID